MKKLITEKTIAGLINDGIDYLVVDDDTIFTPSAKDAVRNNGIKLVREDEAPCYEDKTDIGSRDVKSAVAEAVKDVTCCGADLDRNEVVASVIKVLYDKGILNNILG